MKASRLIPTADVEVRVVRCGRPTPIPAPPAISDGFCHFHADHQPQGFFPWNSRRLQRCRAVVKEVHRR